MCINVNPFPKHCHMCLFNHSNTAAQLFLTSYVLRHLGHILFQGHLVGRNKSLYGQCTQGNSFQCESLLSERPYSSMDWKVLGNRWYPWSSDKVTHQTWAQRYVYTSKIVCRQNEALTIYMLHHLGFCQSLAWMWWMVSSRNDMLGAHTSA